MNFSIQPTLSNNKATLIPLQEADFEQVFAVASDPAIWEQHPNKDRYKREVFRSFFDGALASGGAFKVIDNATGEIAGSTRFYDYDADTNSILIGYTFYATKFWGTGINPSVKKLMLDYIFNYVDTVVFHIGATNVRSQMAIGRIGAKKVAEKEVAYYGEPNRLNFVYEIQKASWQ
ncbi:Protein N-acetyltransferase, RimJ/RimL family [Chitinophaga jiangningensis]|uniref:Protein N-acetyltransferase, RimJ/RimL family n=1 Tax=Chitinophaga jiangningensis TaxID=1419482 RepID=A0A1M7ATA3_9BACT|nr:GNAT family N-acetyltransferase [Chitinophaga jiangningensis]SHL45925.1 Protein N-acetyltransferase, RimJ/RimL family [Chitinophaga jiangningensis]